MSSGGGGFGKSDQSVSSPAANKLANIAEGFAKESEGVRKGLLGTMMEVLKTGGSSLPIISRSVEQTRLASSKATQETEEDLARKGLAGTPFGEMILSQAKQTGNIEAGKVGQGIAQMIFQMIPNFILGQSQTATSGLAGAIPGMNKTSGTEAALALGK